MMSLLDDITDEEVNYTFATFKTSRVVNLQSIENVKNGVLLFNISHRFGKLNDGIEDLFGLDNAQVRFELVYGINDRISVGVGRSSVLKAYDGFTKIHLLRQSSGKRNMPIGLSYFGEAVFVSDNNFLSTPGVEYSTPDKWFYTHQLILARKFNEDFSAQLSPTILHRNLVQINDESNTVMGLGAGGRYMLTGSLSLNLEYVFVPEGQLAEGFKNTFSAGFDVETGGHVFQLHVTNSKGMNNQALFTNTTGEWDAGDIFFGFNISRVFTVKNNHKKPK